MRIEILFSILVTLLGISSILDAFGDLSGTTSGIHILIEMLVGICAIGGLIVIFYRAIALKWENAQLHGNLAKTKKEAVAWKNEADRFISGLSLAIDSQLKQWGLTEAEAEIARLLLKGLSLKEVATVRGTAERTVRQQSLSVYAKSGLAGRAELAAFFLEDLLAPLKNSNSQ